MRLVPWLVVGLLAVSCALPSVDEYSSGWNKGVDANAEALPDGGSLLPADDAATPEADIDSGLPPCPGGEHYCNDFASGRLEDIAATSGVSSEGSLAIVDGELVATITAQPNEGFHAAEIARAIPGAPRKIIVDVDVTADEAAWTTSGNVVVLAIDYNGAPSHHSEELYLGARSSVTTTRAGQYLYTSTSTNLPRGRRVHVRFEADFSPDQQGSYRLLFDGAEVASRTGIDFISLVNVSAQVRLGLRRNRSNNPSPALSVRYDNLVITLPP